MTYRQTYQEFLEVIMQSGGTPDQMKAVVNDYCAVENPDYVPSQDFGVFLLTAEFNCTTCGHRFQLPEDSADPVNMKTRLDQETVCGDCGPTS